MNLLLGKIHTKMVLHTFLQIFRSRKPVPWGNRCELHSEGRELREQGSSAGVPLSLDSLALTPDSLSLCFSLSSHRRLFLPPEYQQLLSDCDSTDELSEMGKFQAQLLGVLFRKSDDSTFEE